MCYENKTSSQLSCKPTWGRPLQFVSNFAPGGRPPEMTKMSEFCSNCFLKVGKKIIVFTYES